MNYELARKLKDAGFPQKGNIILCGLHPVGNCKEWEDDCKKSHVGIPTLSEFIEELGIKFGKLQHVLELGLETWFAYSSKIENELNIPAYIVKQGSTPTEAVANLWLELHK